MIVDFIYVLVDGMSCGGVDGIVIYIVMFKFFGGLVIIKIDMNIG